MIASRIAPEVFSVTETVSCFVPLTPDEEDNAHHD